MFMEIHPFALLSHLIRFANVAFLKECFLAQIFLLLISILARKNKAIKRHSIVDTVNYWMNGNRAFYQ